MTCFVKRRWAPLLGVAFVFACGEQDSEPRKLSREKLLDPATCKQCHEQYYREWAGSMHAYSSKDPVFRAMNQRGQRETNGALGEFCVSCHAPMAVREGATKDGLNLDELPEKLQGVTCYFCHNVDAVEGTHNNPLRLANDTVMRAGIVDPSSSSAHESAYSELLSGRDAKSAELCGACHDIVTPSPPAPLAVQLERTFREWKASVFAPEHAKNESAVVTCNGCHLPIGEEVPIAEAPGLDVGVRTRHLHQLAGVDVALEQFPNTGDVAFDEGVMSEQRQLVQSLLDGSLRVDICVQVLPGNTTAFEVTLDNFNAGHRFPSGAAQDRRAWLEVRAFQGETVLYESGVVPERGDVTALEDPDLWQLRDFAFDAAGTPKHMFWEIARIEEATIPAAITTDPSLPEFYATHLVRRFPKSRAESFEGVPDRVTVLVRIQPMGFDVLDDLIASGDLDASVRERMPVFDLIPNRHLSGELAQLSQVTFEWSEAVRASGRFDVWRDTTAGLPKECMGLRRKQRR